MIKRLKRYVKIKTMTQVRSINDYTILDRLQFPVIGKNGLQIEKPKLPCSKCYRPTISVRAKIVSKRKKLLVIGGSTCYKCKTVSPFKINVTKENYCINTLGKWKELSNE